MVYVLFISQRGQAHLTESYAGRLAILRRLVVISFFAREQPDNNYVLLKADKLVRSAGSPPPAN
jgi:accessory gene regulator protein AgrB